MLSGEVDRTRRVAELLRRELAEVLVREMSDPRLQQVSFTTVKVARDLRTATVHFTVPDRSRAAQTAQVLARAAGHLRHLLGPRLATKAIPALHFRYDESIERGEVLTRLIDQARAQDRAGHDD